MDIKTDTRKIHTLYRLASSIKTAIEKNYTRPYWIKAEMSKLGFSSQTGHCYPSLVEKANGKIIAEMRGIIWANDFEKIHRNFMAVLKEPLKDGIQVLFQAHVAFDPRYGISLRIVDIDPAYILGELEREKRECIEKLKKEGIFDDNKKLPVPLLPKRIAVISQKSSDGYSDFVNVLRNNSFGYGFSLSLFPAALQGDKAVTEIIRELQHIEGFKHLFDVVVIIRGGGGDVGLSCFNQYSLAKKICLFPLPVFTGIGHSTNLTVSEMVAGFNAITPTKLAEDFIQRFHNFAVPVNRAIDLIHSVSKALMAYQKTRVGQMANELRRNTREICARHSARLSTLSAGTVQSAKYRIRSDVDFTSRLPATLRVLLNHKILVLRQQSLAAKETFLRQPNRLITQSRERIESLHKITTLVDPMNAVKRGYSITRKNGKVVKSVANLSAGDQIETVLADGSLESKIEFITPTENG